MNPIINYFKKVWDRKNKASGILNLKFSFAHDNYLKASCTNYIYFQFSITSSFPHQIQQNIKQKQENVI